MSEMPPVPSGPWFNPIAAHLGQAYWAPDTGRVMAFTKGTVQEATFLVDALDLGPGSRVFDAGCGPGRHALELARRGISVHGLDRSPEFVDLARGAAEAEDLDATFEVADLRTLADEGEYDAVVCLCQGGFGLLGGHDEPEVLRRLAVALVPGGRLALTAFSAYFVAGALEPGETLDAATGVLHERATLRNPDGQEKEFDMWTTCFTPRELALLATAAGLTVDAVHAVAPGDYAPRPPDLDHPEHLLVAHRRHRDAGLPPDRPAR